MILYEWLFKSHHFLGCKLQEISKESWQSKNYSEEEKEAIKVLYNKIFGDK